MAAPRPGWSRRAQYGLFFSFLAVLAGLIVGLIMLTLSLLAPDKYQAVRGAALDATAPITGGLRAVTDTVKGMASGAGNYWDAAHQNAQLKRDRAALMRKMVEAQAVLQENRQLKATLQLRERTRETVATGRIVGSSFASPRRFAIFSAGSQDGVAIGMPVRSATGLVGRIIAIEDEHWLVEQLVPDESARAAAGDILCHGELIAELIPNPESNHDPRIMHHA